MVHAFLSALVRCCLLNNSRSFSNKARTTGGINSHHAKLQPARQGGKHQACGGEIYQSMRIIVNLFESTVNCGQDCHPNVLTAGALQGVYDPTLIGPDKRHNRQPHARTAYEGCRAASQGAVRVIEMPCWQTVLIPNYHVLGNRAYP
jgi:hypothetical protein